LVKALSVLVCWLAAIAVVQGDPKDGQTHQTTVVQPVQVPPVARKVKSNAGGKFDARGNFSRENSIVRPKVVLSGHVNRNGQRQDYHWRRFNLDNKIPSPRIASAKFNQNNRIAGSERWEGKNYSAFRSYQAQWHDRNWWRHHHNRIVLIGGGYYYWDSGFWYPAWGYDAAYSYYPYDGPIYAYNDLTPDQVIANVQAALWALGYYAGQIDGLLGPLTRAALAEYQRDQGLYTTAAIDQPTLASLGMG